MFGGDLGGFEVTNSKTSQNTPKYDLLVCVEERRQKDDVV